MSYLNRLNSLLTSTTSRYDSLRRNILSSSSEDDSSITSPDSTHVTRVLRAYYTEKARPFPAWLGPDPRSPAPASSLTPTSQPVYATARPVTSLRRNTSGGGGGGLGEIWDDGAGEEGNGRSLRRGAGRRVLGRGGGVEVQRGKERQGEGVRPLPSQRAGSYQQGGGVVGERMGGVGLQGERMGGVQGERIGSSGGGAAERLKARLNRGGSGQGGGGSYATQGLSGWQGAQGRR